jgi:two-component system CheB/CheR fusion protein
MLVFSGQDVLRDPPFSKLDLISCRNLLIYLNAALQKKLIPLFHYALNPEGVLFLGILETVGEFTSIFKSLERRFKIYQKKEITNSFRPVPGNFLPLPDTNAARQRSPRTAGGKANPINFHDLTQQSLLEYNDQAGALVTGRGEILYIVGRTGNYLEPAPGDMAANILPMAREGLRQKLTVVLQRAVAQKKPVCYPNLQVKTHGDFFNVDLAVRPAAGSPDLFLVVMEPSPLVAETEGQHAVAASAESDSRIAVLEQELRAKEEYLQSTLEEMETAKEELKSTNEEMQSVNEEQQHTNEELETSKQELQSVNEELSTAKAELQTKVADLSKANSGMNNLLAGTGIGTLFVDCQLRITRFTPAAI